LSSSCAAFHIPSTLLLAATPMRASAISAFHTYLIDGVSIFPPTRARARACPRAHTFTHLHTHTLTPVCMPRHTRTNTHTQACKFRVTQTHVHTHTHTHSHKRALLIRVLARMMGHTRTHDTHGSHTHTRTQHSMQRHTLAHTLGGQHGTHRRRSNVLTNRRGSWRDTRKTNARQTQDSHRGGLGDSGGEPCRDVGGGAKAPPPSCPVPPAHLQGARAIEQPRHCHKVSKVTCWDL
jgi:hypothetical protein